MEPPVLDPVAHARRIGPPVDGRGPSPLGSAAWSRLAPQRTDRAQGWGRAAAYTDPIRTVGWPEMLDQGLAGFVLQLLECGSADHDRQALGLGFQAAGAFAHNAEHDFSHQGYRSRCGSILGRLARSCWCGGIRGTGRGGTRRRSPKRQPRPRPTTPARRLSRGQRAHAPDRGCSG